MSPVMQEALTRGLPALRQPAAAWQIFDGSPYATFVVCRGRIFYANPACTRLFASSLDLLLGRSPLELIRAGTEHPMQFRLAAVESRDVSLPVVEEEWLTPHGKTVPVQVTAWSAADGDQRVLIVQAREAAAAPSLEPASRGANTLAQRQLSELELLYGRVPVGLAHLDTDLRFVHVNEPMAAMNGRSMEAHAGQQFQELITPQAATLLDPLLRRVLSTGQPLRDFVWQELSPASAPAMRQLIAHFHPLKAEDGTVTGVGAAMLDITERLRVEEALRQSNGALRRSNDDLQQFAFAASHDLQEPLRTIRGYSQELLDQSGGLEQTRKCAALIGEASARMQQLIHDLLLYAQAGNPGHAHLRTISLDDTLQWAVMNLHGALQESGAILQREPLPRVQADAQGMAQLLQNLIGNAIKYRSPGRTPEIHIRAERGPSEWIVAISDNGIGIAPEHQERIFGVFTRLHGTQYPGTGVGLALCRRIVERHGGRLWVESTPGQGATFRFSLPAE